MHSKRGLPLLCSKIRLRRRHLYGQLDTGNRQIRLLTLKPKDVQDATLDCTLEIASLDDEPDYSALSYVWGDPKITKTIRVNGCAIPVTANLEAALKRIRDKGSDWAKGRLWVDAVCTNQSDIAERNAQVAMMCDIYQHARKVIVWLGETGADGRTTENVARAMSIISSWRGLNYNELAQSIEHFKTHQPDQHERNARSLAALLRADYWTRTW